MNNGALATANLTNGNPVERQKGYELRVPEHAHTRERAAHEIDELKKICGLAAKGARERLADRALGRSLSSSGKPWITLGSLLLGAASAHVFGHNSVITDLQLGVIHRPETS